MRGYSDWLPLKGSGQPTFRLGRAALSENEEVTVDDQNSGMERSAQCKGVCVVTITRQPVGLLIKISTRPDVGKQAGQGAQTVTTIDEAVSALQEFLILFSLANDVE